MRIHLMLVAVAVLTCTLSAHADSVFVKGREKSLDGTVKSEDAKGVTITVKARDEFVPAADVIDVHYDVLPLKLRLGGPYQEAKNAEKDFNTSPDPAKRKAAVAIAIAKYAATITGLDKDKIEKANLYGRRNFDYKIAILTLRQAQAEQTPIKPALAKLDDFKKKYPNSWQINHVLPTLAQLHMDGGDYASAAAIYAEMAEMEVFPGDVRRNAELMVVQVSVKAGDFKSAQKKLDDLEKKAAGNQAFLARVKMTRAEVLVGEKKTDDAVPILQQLLKETKDTQVKAQAHNALGECLFKADRYSEAVWEFLYVDTVYSQDKGERAKALYYLWKTFERLNNEERSKECRQMLVSDPQFTGTEYQMRALKESK